MSYIWSPLFLVFAYAEYGSINYCGTMHLTGQMWFMWLMMGLASSKVYIDLIKSKLNGSQ